MQIIPDFFNMLVHFVKLLFIFFAIRDSCPEAGKETMGNVGDIKTEDINKMYFLKDFKAATSHC